MAAPQAVGNVAVARSEVRKSLDRLEYHLGRGARGAKGVRREIAYLDALHRQTVRLSGRAVGAAYTGRPLESFGTKAAEGLVGSGRARGRMKSSILADFSSDGLQPTRDWTRGTNDLWIWTANASACPTCLAKHGRSQRGGFVPSHPSCLCIPTPFLDARDQVVRPLSHDELVSTAREYGDPRYYKRLSDFENGLIDFDDLAQIENVNGQARGLAKFREHLAKGEVRQTGLPGSTTPQPPNPTPPTSTPQPPTPKPKPKDDDWLGDLKPKVKEPHPDIDLDGFSERTLREILDDGLDPNYDLTAIKAKIRKRLDEIAEDIDDLKPPKTLKEWREAARRGEVDIADVPSHRDLLKEWNDYAYKKHLRQRLGPATNAERAEVMRGKSFADEVADGLKGKRSKKAKLEYLEEEAQKRWPLHADGTETLFDLTGLDPRLALENLDNMFKLAERFPVPAQRLRYVGTMTDTTKMLAGRTNFNWDISRVISDRILGKKPRYWSQGKNPNTYAWVQKTRAGDEYIMAWNPKHYAKYDDYLRASKSDVLTGWSPPGVDTATRTITHEYGHLVDYWMDDIRKIRLSPVIDYTDSASVDTLWSRLRRKYTSPVSRYAKKNEREEWAEYFCGLWERGETSGAEWRTWSHFWDLAEDSRGRVGLRTSEFKDPGQLSAAESAEWEGLKKELKEKFGDAVPG